MKKLVISLLLTSASQFAFGSNYSAISNDQELGAKVNNFAIKMEELKDREENHEHLSKKISNLDTRFNNLSKELASKSSQYHHLIHWLRGRVNSGHLDKYDFTKFPETSLYRSVNPKYITNIARLTQAVYNTSDDKTANKDFSSQLDLFKEKTTLGYQYKDIQRRISFVKKQKERIEDIQDELFSMDRDEFSRWMLKFFTGVQNVFGEKNPILDGCGSDLCYCQSFQHLNDKLSNSLVTLESKAKQIEQQQFELSLEDNPHKLSLEDQVVFQEPQFKNFKIIDIMYRNGNEFSGAVLYNSESNEMIIVFAGSKSGGDWFNNLQAWGKNGNSELNIGGHQFSLHKGVLNLLSQGLENSIKKLNTFIERQNDKEHKTPMKILVAGHSLGGALSTLISYHIKSHILPIYGKNRPNIKNAVVQNINFGSPRFVDPKGAQVIEETLGKGNVLRFWNSRDIVPSIVLGVANSKHVGIDIPLWDSFSHDWYIPLISHHSMSRYWALSAVGFMKVRDENSFKIETTDELNLMADYVSYLKEADSNNNEAMKNLKTELGISVKKDNIEELLRNELTKLFAAYKSKETLPEDRAALGEKIKTLNAFLADTRLIEPIEEFEVVDFVDQNGLSSSILNLENELLNPKKSKPKAAKGWFFGLF